MQGRTAMSALFLNLEELKENLKMIFQEIVV